MFPTLLESDRKADKRRIFGVGVVSAAIHAGVIAAVVFGTLHAARSDTTVQLDTTVVVLAPQQHSKPPEEQPAQLEVPLRGFQTIVVPAEIPSDIPPVDLHERFDPKDYSGSGV